MADARNVHVSPVAAPEHNTNGLTCWCHPRIEQVCPECEDDASAKLACWRCERTGWVPCAAPDLYDGVYGLLIVHNDIEVSHGTT